jgi:hypothetical protein
VSICDRVVADSHYRASDPRKQIARQIEAEWLSAALLPPVFFDISEVGADAAGVRAISAHPSVIGLKADGCRP